MYEALMRNWLTLIYGAALVILGFIGYANGSKVSLYSGGSFGLLLVVSAIMMFKNVKWGSYLAIAITAALTIVFTIRYCVTGKNLPVILAAISVTLLFILLAQSVKWKRTGQ